MSKQVSVLEALSFLAAVETLDKNREIIGIPSVMMDAMNVMKDAVRGATYSAGENTIEIV